MHCYEGCGMAAHWSRDCISLAFKSPFKTSTLPCASSMTLPASLGASVYFDKYLIHCIQHHQLLRSILNGFAICSFSYTFLLPDWPVVLYGSSGPSEFQQNTNLRVEKPSAYIALDLTGERKVQNSEDNGFENTFIGAFGWLNPQERPLCSEKTNPYICDQIRCWHMSRRDPRTWPSSNKNHPPLSPRLHRAPPAK